MKQQEDNIYTKTISTLLCIGIFCFLAPSVHDAVYPVITSPGEFVKEAAETICIIITIILAAPIYIILQPYILE